MRRVTARWRRGRRKNGGEVIVIIVAGGAGISFIFQDNVLNGQVLAHCPIIKPRRKG